MMDALFMFSKVKFVKFFFKKRLKRFIPFFSDLFSNYPASPSILGLKINKKSTLGIKNEIVYMPFDKTLTWWVISEGAFKHFILNHVKKINEDFIFIDIGANVGLISKQISNIAKKRAYIHCFEPNMLNFNCLELNVGKIATCYNFGLSNKNEKKTLYKLNDNHGHSTFLVNSSFDAKEECDLKDINIELNKIIKDRKNSKTKIVLKIDTEGYDLFLISVLKKEILNKIDLICFEYSNSDFKEFNQKILQNNLNYFDKISSDNGTIYTSKQISDTSIKGQIDIIMEK
jgi:FkbM family methyltransferase